MAIVLCVPRLDSSDTVSPPDSPPAARTVTIREFQNHVDIKALIDVLETPSNGGVSQLPDRVLINSCSRVLSTGRWSPIPVFRILIL